MSTLQAVHGTAPDPPCGEFDIEAVAEDAIRAAMEEELADLSWTEMFSGTAFLAAGPAAREPSAYDAGERPSVTAGTC